MKLIEVFLGDSESVPKTFMYKVKNGLVTLQDQEEALTKPKFAYWFAFAFSEADIRKCEEVACQNPCYACYFYFDIIGADINKCEEAACKSSEWKYWFTREQKFRLLPKDNGKQISINL